MIQKIPTDIELFNKYINVTDDRQFVIHEYLIPTISPDGKWDYTNAAKKIDDKNRRDTWDWPNDRSEQWSKFRKINDDLYANLANAQGDEREQLKSKLNANIKACIDYDKEHKVVEGILLSDKANYDDKEAFGVQQDLYEIDNPIHKISFKYEKQIPFSELDKELIAKYVEMHNELPLTTKYVIEELNAMTEKLPAFWERLFICKEKGDKASNTICMPPPPMKGSYGPVVSFYMPTAEEQKQYIDDFNKYIDDLINDTNAYFEHVSEVQKLIYDDEEDPDTSESLFYQVDRLYHKLFDKDKNSIDICTFDENFDDFKGAWSDERKKMQKVSDEFSLKNNVFGDVWEELYDLLKAKFAPKPKNVVNLQQASVNPTSNPDFDEFKKETLQRFESGISNFFDAEDWHVIIDNFEAKHDDKNKEKYLEIALTQHPESAKLLIRKASEEADKHEYKNALSIIDKAETLESQHHPNFYLIKGRILCNLYLTNQAIPLYEKLFNSKGIGLDHYQEIAYYNLIDIYEGQKNYLECISITKDMLDKHKDNDTYTARLCSYYRMAGLLKEAEELVTAYLEKNPDNAICNEELGHIYNENKEYWKAINQYDKAFEINKEENYNSLFYKGKAYVERKDYSDAATCFETCVLYYHFGKEYHIAAMHCYKELNMPYLVDYHINKILELDPEFSESLNIIKEQSN